jgi:hypothetical protein
MLRWEDREAFLQDEARRDLEACTGVRPCLVAMRGPEPLLVGFFRAFGPGRHLDPLVELLALAAPLEADRLAVSLPGVATRLDAAPAKGRRAGPDGEPAREPQQRVLVIDEVDASAGEPAICTAAWPYTTGEKGLEWGVPLRADGGSGAMSAALAVAVARRRQLRAGPGELRAQAERCVRLGHLLALAPRIHQELCG